MIAYINKYIPIVTVFAILGLISCSSDDNGEGDMENTIIFPIKEGLEVPNGPKVFDGLILVNDAAANRVYFMDKTTEIVYELNLNEQRLGNDVTLLDDGRFLAMLESEDAHITLGGNGGVLAILDKEGATEWSFKYSDENHIAHHDAEMLPNGNILFLSWERKSQEEATAAGFSEGTEIIYDAVLEINPDTNEIVWQWHMWDHLIQEHDADKENFGVIAENPRRIDINYLEVTNDEGDVSHANGIAYDATKDLIYISANFYSEVWVVDHSTTTEQARSNTGGNYGFGGDLVYRFGNPSTYKNTTGTRLFDRNHHPNLLAGEKEGNMLIYSNGVTDDQSTVYELKIPEDLSLNADEDNEPEIVWQFTDPDLFAGRVSGADLLPNGNRLITEGDFGFWEVTENGEVVWRYTTDGFFWRGYHYDKTDIAIQNLGLTFP